MRRRRFLQGALALPALSGCLSSSRRPRVEGEILGLNHRLGHQLRDGAAPPFSGPRRQVPVLIAGGGIAGLSAAWRLRQSGLEDFLVLELEDELGGNSRASYYPASPAPWAAHYLPVPTRESKAVLRLLREMGILRGFSPSGEALYEEMELCHAPEERLYAFGDWDEGLVPRFGASARDLQQFRSFEQHIADWQRWRDRQGRKAFAIPLELSSPDLHELDRISMAEYLRRHGWDSPRLLWYVEYGCRDDYGASLQNTSAWAGLHYFAARDAVIEGRTRETQFVWPEGNHHLVRHLARGLEERHRTGELVARVQRRAGRWEVDTWDGQQARGYSATRLICALPTFVRSYAFGEKPPPEFTYSPWTVSNVVLERMPDSAYAPKVGLCWDNVLYDSPSLGYVVATHQTLSHRKAPSVWTHYRPWTEMEPAEARRQMLETRWESIRDRVLGELAGVHPDLPPLVRRLDVMQLGHGMIRPAPGFLWGPARRRAGEKRDGLYFAHSDLSGISIFEEANYRGVLAAQQLLAEDGARVEDFLT